MTAAELYSLVKDDPEVWADGDGLDYHAEKGWVQFSSDVPSEAHAPVWLPAYMAERELEALYARATGCGVAETIHDTFVAVDLDGQTITNEHPTRLAALVAAYRANKETKR